MRVNSMENSVGFKSLKIKENPYRYLAGTSTKIFEKKLANTKRYDVIVDSHGFSIKDKKTELINKIQSFSLFIKEKAVGINLLGNSKQTFKVYFDELEEAENLWNELRVSDRSNRLESYAKATLILDNQIDYKC